jgi:hypothetical protein
LLAIDSAGGDIEGEPLPVVTISSGIESVQAKENNRRCHRCALVPVKIPTKIKMVSRSDIDEINVRRLPPKLDCGANTADAKSVSSRIPYRPPKFFTASL